MKYEIFSIKDAQTGFGQLVLDTSEAAAMRGFRLSLAQSYDDLKKMAVNLDELALYGFGTFDSESGVFDLYPLPKFLMAGSEEFLNEK